MKRAHSELGDSHNFGRRVALRDGRVKKPRTLLWEWLLLAAESPLRQLLQAAGQRAGLGADAFGFLPTLKFYPARSGLGGEVEQVSLEPLRARSSQSRRELASVVGRSLALWSFLGVSDLHWENLVLGVGARGQIVFGPLDIEIILADLSLPTETKLLPDADPEYAAICQHACGVRRVLPYLGKPIEAADLTAMAGAYLECLTFLERQAGAIAKIFARLPALREAPIRVCLRSTEEYVLAESQPLWPPLLDAERVQLERADIPYFFRLYGRKGIHYYKNRALTELERLPLRGDVPQLDATLNIARGLASSSRQKLREQGLLTVLQAFDHPDLSGRHVGQGLELELKAKSLLVRLQDGTKLRAQRGASAEVSSVYQPCRCGEVRTVFVPAVTRCSAAASAV